MTHDDWMSLLRTVITLAIPPLLAWAFAAWSGLIEHFRAWLVARKQAQLAAIVGAANTMLQSAMENSAGNLAMAVRQGQLDPTDMGAVRQWAVREAGLIRGKLPQATMMANASDAGLVDGITGKVPKVLPVPTPPAPVVLQPDVVRGDLSTGSFQARAAIVVGRLMRDLSLTREQAAGIVGNLGQESGLQAINEVRPVSGRGGWGWAQWTGPRRVAMEAWCKAQGLLVTDPEANYGFLIEELRTTESAALAALRQTTTLEEATRVFEEKFERAGVVALARRQTFAEQAMAA